MGFDLVRRSLCEAAYSFQTASKPFKNAELINTIIQITRGGLPFFFTFESLFCVFLCAFSFHFGSMESENCENICQRKTTALFGSQAFLDLQSLKELCF